MLELDSDVLKGVLPALGRGTPATATQPVAFDDELLQQTLEVSQLVRRAGTFPGHGGIYGFRLELDMPGTLPATGQHELQPYGNFAALLTLNNDLPEDIPEGLDAWFLWAEVSRTAGSVNPIAMDLYLQLFGVGPTTTSASNVGVEIANWLGASAIDLDALGTVYPDTQGRTGIPLGFRCPRDGSQLIWRVRDDGVGAFTVRMDGILGYFPSGLGQDAVSGR